VPQNELPLETTPADVKRRLDAGESLHLIDVREPFEHQIAHIANSELVPMNTVPAALQEFERKSDEGVLIVFCHHGMRSLSVANWLRQQGVTDCQSMAGGIDRWSAEIDAAVPRY
jgi:rhodanese-related sulfurtransferase